MAWGYKTYVLFINDISTNPHNVRRPSNHMILHASYKPLKFSHRYHPSSPTTPLNSNDNHQRSHRDSKRDKRHQHNSPPTGREFAPNHPVLRLQIPLIPQKQRQHTNDQKRGAERLAQMSQSVRLSGLVS